MMRTKIKDRQNKSTSKQNYGEIIAVSDSRTMTDVEKKCQKRAQWDCDETMIKDPNKSFIDPVNRKLATSSLRLDPLPLDIEVPVADFAHFIGRVMEVLKCIPELETADQWSGN